MSENEKYTLDIVLEHLKVCEKRFSEINTPYEFVRMMFHN
jgi:hypothetical protein